MVLTLPRDVFLQPRLTSIDGRRDIHFQARAYLYVQLFPPSFFANQRCFQIDFGGSNITGYMQFVYKTDNTISKKSIIQQVVSTDLCATRRVKCKNGGQCRILSNGQTKCLCPDHTSGTNCENGRLNSWKKTCHILDSYF